MPSYWVIRFTKDSLGKGNDPTQRFVTHSNWLKDVDGGKKLSFWKTPKTTVEDLRKGKNPETLEGAWHECKLVSSRGYDKFSEAYSLTKLEDISSSAIEEMEQIKEREVTENHKSGKRRRIAKRIAEGFEADDDSGEEERMAEKAQTAARKAAAMSLPNSVKTDKKISGILPPALPVEPAPSSDKVKGVAIPLGSRSPSRHSVRTPSPRSQRSPSPPSRHSSARKSTVSSPRSPSCHSSARNSTVSSPRSPSRHSLARKSTVSSQRSPSRHSSARKSTISSPRSPSPPSRNSSARNSTISSPRSPSLPSLHSSARKSTFLSPRSSSCHSSARKSTVSSPPSPRRHSDRVTECPSCAGKPIHVSLPQSTIDTMVKEITECVLERIPAVIRKVNGELLCELDDEKNIDVVMAKMAEVLPERMCNMEDFEGLEEKLKISKYRKRMVDGLIAGHPVNTAQALMRECLRDTMSSALLEKFSYQGKLGKHPFSGTNFHKVLLTVCLKGLNKKEGKPMCARKGIEDTLRNASFGPGGSKDRSKRKRNEDEDDDFSGTEEANLAMETGPNISFLDEDILGSESDDPDYVQEYKTSTESEDYSDSDLLDSELTQLNDDQN